MGGFFRPMKVHFEILNIDVLEARAESGTHDTASLAALRIISGKHPVKLLGRGEVKKKYAISVHAASEGAKKAIEKAGGSVIIVRS